MSLLITGFAVAAGMALLLASVKSKPDHLDGKKVMSYGVPLKIFSAITIVAFIGVSLAASQAKSREMVMTLISTVVFFLASISLIMEFFIVEISYNDDNIFTKSAWRKSRIIPWTDVKDIVYSRSMQWHVISTYNNGSIRIHDFLGGKVEFLNSVKSIVKNRH